MKNIRITDDAGTSHFIFYHNIIGHHYEPEVVPDPDSENPLGRKACCKVHYRCDEANVHYRICTVTGPKADRLKVAVENGVIDLDEGDFVAQQSAALTDLLQPSQHQLFLRSDPGPITVFYNPCGKMPRFYQHVYGYYLGSDDSITMREVYLDGDGEWTSVAANDEVATPLLYCEKPPAPSPTVEALQEASDLQDQGQG